MKPLILEIAYRDPLRACAPLRDQAMTLLLHSCGDHPLARWSFVMTDPIDVFGADSKRNLQEFDHAHRWIADHRTDGETTLPPFVGGIAGAHQLRDGRRF